VSIDAKPTQHRTLPQNYRLQNRIMDLRTSSSQAIFRIQSAMGSVFRNYLDGHGFIEIHTPKLQASATESGASVFEVNYFGRPAFLAQSPQLAKQMSVAADFERVYEVGAVFRAEDSNTPRHLTEYTGLDFEMAIEEHYHEALDIIDGYFKTLWKTLYERYGKEIELVSQFYPQEKVVWLEETPRLKFSEGIKMLRESGYTDDDGQPPSETEDLSTAAERRLGELVKEKYKTDYYILDKFPASVRPFYTMPDAENPDFSNSFDIFLRGQEIVSGGQRIHDAAFLEKRMRKLGIKPESMNDYMEGFRWGAPPHAGAGIGLERLCFLFLNLGNIRLASLFHRDPRALPRRTLTELPLRHPEASTTNPPWDNEDFEGTPGPKDFQPLEKLIANYGDAANTSWLDERYQVWRHPETGAAQGFVDYRGFAITVGEPLCAKNQYSQVISAYLEYLKTDRGGLKPLWLMAGPAVEEFLGEKHNWRTISPIAEQRVNPRESPALDDAAIARKVRHAAKEGVKNFEWPSSEKLPEEWMAKVNERIAEWKKNRKGEQVHLTEIRPWVDQEHRRYFFAAQDSREGKVHAVLVLHQLSPEHGYQVKFSLEFPEAPSGTIESLNLFGMRSIVTQDPDVKTLTYGTGAMDEILAGHNVGNTKMKVLARSYETIERRLKLTNKTEWRQRLGAKEERVWICYPRGGMGGRGVKAIVDFMQEDDDGGS
jgi:aspartyl-tRNA synthetase